VFLWELRQSNDLATARTAAVNTVVLFEIFYLFSARFLGAPSLTRAGLFGSHAVLAAIASVVLLQLFFTYLSFLRQLFGTAAWDGATWLRAILVATSVIVLVEAEKWWFRRRAAANAH